MTIVIIPLTLFGTIKMPVCRHLTTKPTGVPQRAFLGRK